MASCLRSVFVRTLACAEASRLPMDISLSCRTVRSTRQRLNGTTACGGGQTSSLSPSLRRLRAARVLSVPQTRSGGPPPPCHALRHKSAWPALFATLCQHFYLCICMCAGRCSLLTSHAWVSSGFPCLPCKNPPTDLPFCRSSYPPPPAPHSSTRTPPRMEPISFSSQTDRAASRMQASWSSARQRALWPSHER